MNFINKGLLWTLISALLITSCNLPNEESGKATQTALFETVVAGITQTMAAKPTGTNTPPASPTLPLIPPTTNPMQIPTIPPSIPTVAITPCNRATFVADVTVPDGTKIDAGASFKKTWRLQNSGTCTWTSGYTVVYVAGERMGAPESEAFTTGTVAPGASVDVSMTLTAPTAPGSYTAYFRLRAADGVQFGVLTNAGGTFYVQIAVSGATATAGVLPTITGMSPSTVVAGSSDFILTLTGANYVSGAVIKWGTTSLATNYISATKLTATVLYQYVTTVGTYYVTIVNPSGATSTVAAFYVTSASNPVPTLSNISPTSATAGSGNVTLTVSGTNFVNGSQVKWNGSTVTTTYNSATQLTATIPAAALTTAGTYSVTVFNPAPGGGTSGAASFTVNAAANPAPTITQLIPPSAPAGSPDTAIQVIGPGNFVSSATISLNGTAVATTYIGTGELRATIPAALLTTAGTNVTVTVTNPAPGGGSIDTTFFVN